MKLLQTYSILLLACGSVFAQDSIFKADGSRAAIIAESVKFDLRNKQILYVLKNETVNQTVKLKDLDKITYDGKRFEMLKIGKKKLKGYNVLAQRDGLTLATLRKEITTSSGGFNQKYINNELVVVKGDKIIDRISFTENNDDKNINRRVKAKQMIELYFGECIEVVERLAFFANAANNSLIEGDVASYLRQAPYLLCP